MMRLGEAKNSKQKCQSCHKQVIWNSKAVDCHKCENWYHTKCQNISTEQNGELEGAVWKSFERENSPTYNNLENENYVKDM